MNRHRFTVFERSPLREAVAALLVMPGFATALDSSFLEAFKQHIAKSVISCEVAFVEGEVDAPAAVNVEKATTAQGEVFIIAQSQRRYTALCQSNGFALIQPTERLPITQGGKSFQVVAGLSCGYFEDQFWYQDGAGPMLVGRSGDTNAVVVDKLVRISEYESKTWSIYFLGLPKLDSSTVRWDEKHMVAKGVNGADISADILVNERGMVTNLIYSCSNNTIEQATVAYYYTGTESSGALPDRYEKRVLNAPDPYQAARASWNVRVIKLNGGDTVVDQQEWLAATRQPSILVSNGVIFSKSGQGHVPQISQMDREKRGQSQVAKRKLVSYMVVGMVVVTSIALWFSLRSHNRKNNIT